MKKAVASLAVMAAIITDTFDACGRERASSKISYDF